MRYVWDLADDYLGARAGLATRLLAPPVAAGLRRWDRRNESIHGIVAISHHIAERIRRVWGREADVIHPPVDVERFRIADRVDDYYLVVSALVPYKRIDLAIGAARRLGRRLLIVGTGPEERRLKALAGPFIEFLGWRDDREVAELYARCRAVLFPAVEDFGIVPLEAAAAGRPTVALGRGGVLETMVPLGAEHAAPTALFFAEQTVEALAGAIRAFEAAEDRFDPKALRERAREFDRPVFKRRLAEYVETRWREAGARQAC